MSIRSRPAVTTWLTIALVWAVALGTFGWSLADFGPPERWAAVAILAALGYLSKALPPSLLRNDVRLSLSSIVLLTAIPLVGPTGAALVGAFSVLGQVGRTRLQAAVFNMAMHAVMGGLSGLAYVGCGGLSTPRTAAGPFGLLTDIGLPLLVADLVQCLVNAALLALIVRVSTGSPFGAQLRFIIGSSGGAYVGYGVLSFLIYVLWVPAGVGAFSTVLILAPLLVARWALGQYGAELQAHNRTLTALVSAIEIKSPSLAGQSAAVATVCDWIGDELHLPSAEVDAARTAGMLHDIGLLGLPADLLRPNHVITAGEEPVLRDHSVAAARMLEGISFLDRAVSGVVHHHERFAGGGYPDGLAGDDIPLIARVVAVADGYVALLAARSDRRAMSSDEALDRLRELAGTAYDPAVVAALAGALARHAAPGGLDVEPLAVLGSAVAHDEPDRSPAPEPTPVESGEAPTQRPTDDPTTRDIFRVVGR